MRGLLISLFFLTLIISTVSCGTTGGLASFTLSDLTIEPRAPSTGALFSVSVTVANTGNIQGTYNADMFIDELNIDGSNNATVISTKTYNKSAAIKEGESAIITFDSLSLQEGTYTIKIGDLVDYVEVGC